MCALFVHKYTISGRGCKTQQENSRVRIYVPTPEYFLAWKMRIDSKGYRPDRIADILPHARHREARGTDFGLAFDMAKREFLDAFYIMEDAQRAESLQAEPERVGPLEDTQLGALAEQLARNFRLPLPAWTEQPWR